MKKIYSLLIFAAISFSFVFAQVEGTWQMAKRDNSIGVGPMLNDFSWFSLPAADTTTRACWFDDRFIFEADGTFKNEQDGETWLEAWQGVAADECGTPVAPHDGSNAATWTIDTTAGTLTLNGVGAHLGLAKVINGAEISNPADAPASITYNYQINADGDLIIDIDFGGGWWHYELTKTESTSSIEKLAKDIYSVYPNPASSEIRVQTTEMMDGMTLRDLTGRTIMTKVNPAMSETINVSNLPKGLYLLELRSGNQVGTEKIVVN
jgi:hypothetical protein